MLNRTNIEEANKHLQALYKRVGELEEIVQEQNDALQKKDSFIQTKIQERSQQDLQIQKLQSQLYEREKLLQERNDEIELLTQDIDSKSKEISFLKQQNRSLNDFMKLASDLKSIVTKFDGVVDIVHDSVRYGYNDITDSPNDGGYDSTFHNRNDYDDDDDDGDDSEYTDDEDSASLNGDNINQDKEKKLSHNLSGRSDYCEKPISNYEGVNATASGDFRNNHVNEFNEEHERALYSTSGVIDERSSGDSLQHTFSLRKTKTLSEGSDVEESIVLNSSTSSQKEVYF